MRIGEASVASGIPERLIRYYEAQGLVPAAARITSGYRSYGDATIALLRLIARAREVGLSLDDIRDVTAAEGAERAVQASRLLTELGRKERTIGGLRADLERIVLEAAD